MQGIRTRRLTAEQERDLARRIRAAERDARKAVAHVPVARAEIRRKPKRVERTRAGAIGRLEAAVEAAWHASKSDRSLREAAREGKEHLDTAERLRWELAMSGRRIAVGEARKLAGPYMDHVDLVQEGYVGLLRAAKRFDPDRGIRFSTYARWWVRAQMTRAIDHHGRTVRLPGCAVEQSRNLRKAMKAFDVAGEDYTVSDLASEVGISNRRARFLLSRGQTISLDQPVDQGPRPRSVEQFLQDEDAIDPDADAIRAQEIRRMLDAVDELLSERHRHVLTQRYGLDDDTFRTLADIGKGMDLSRERVRQLEAEALRTLRQHGEIREVA